MIYKMNEIAHYNSFVDWSDGVPVVVYKQMLTKDIIVDLPLAAVSMPYERTEEEVFLGIDEDLEGKTIAEVMDIRLARNAARGDKESYKILKDRILGKPKQEIQSTKLTMSYTEYLEKITEEEGEEIIDVTD